MDRVREVVGVERAAPALFSLPSQGRLLVASDSGVWVVESNGKKRLLAGYREAGWSPFGRFVVATRENELAALEPDGDVRWTLARRNVRSPRWTGSETDTRIAYLTGRALRVVGGDGRGDRPLARTVRPVAPAWRPGGGYVVTYVDGANRVVTLDAERRQTLWRATGRGAVEALEWSSDGRRLHVLRAGRVDVLTREGRPWTGLRPARGEVTAEAIIPGSHAYAAAVAQGARSDVVLVREGGGRIFAGEGRFTGPRVVARRPLATRQLAAGRSVGLRSTEHGSDRGDLGRLEPVPLAELPSRRGLVLLARHRDEESEHG